MDDEVSASPERVPEDDTGATRGTVRSGLGFAASSFVINAAVGLLSAVITARLYGIAVIGEYALVAAPWVLLIQLSSMSEQTALTRELASVPPRHPVVAGLFLPVLAFSAALTTVVAVAVGTFGAAALGGPIDQGDLVAPSVAILVGYVVLDNTSWNLDAVLAAFIAGRELFWARLIQAAAFPALTLVIRPFSSTVWGLVLATLLSFGVGFALRVVLVRRYMGLRPSRGELRRGLRSMPTMLGFGLRLLPGRLAGGVTSQAGVWILGITSSISAVGAYARANSVAVRINDAGFRVGEILFPALVARHRAGDLEGFEHLLRRTLRLAAFPLLLASSVAGGVAAGLLSVFGRGFDDAAGAFSALMLAYSVFVLVMIQNQVLLATDRVGISSILSVARAAVTLGLMVALAPSMGGTGIAVAILVGMCQSWQLQAWLIRRTVLHAPARRDQVFALGAALSAAAGFGAARSVHVLLTEPVATFAGGAAGVAAFAAVALLTGFVRPEDRQSMLRLFTDRVRPRLRPAGSIV